MPSSLPVSPALQTIDDPAMGRAGVRLDLLRLDRIHPSLGGNKWFKLKHNLRQAHTQGYQTLLSFGGAYSNHIRALAAGARLAGLESIGVIRGELCEPLNPVLSFASGQGMRLHPVSRAAYRCKQDPDFLDGLRQQFGDFFLIPEGGCNELGLLGCEEIVDLLASSLNLTGATSDVTPTIATACGTGATLAGMIRRAGNNNFPWEFLGVSVLRDGGSLEKAVGNWTDSQPDLWQINGDYHFGGYARSDHALLKFIDQFTRTTGIPLEPVYTGKLLFAIYDLVQRGRIHSGSHVIALHTGGIH